MPSVAIISLTSCGKVSLSNAQGDDTPLALAGGDRKRKFSALFS